MSRKLCEQKHFRNCTRDTKGFSAADSEHSHLYGGQAFPTESTTSSVTAQSVARKHFLTKSR